MRNFRRLPPFLRVAFILGLLFVLAALAVLIEAIMSSLSSFPHWSADVERLGLIGVNLSMVSGACSFAVGTYSLRFRHPDRGPFLLDSWQSQVRAIALLSALPLCGIALALIIPSTSLAFVVVFLISFLAALVLLVAHVSGAVVSAAAGGGAGSRPT